MIADQLPGVDRKIIRHALTELIQLNSIVINLKCIPEKELTRRRLLISQVKLLRLLLSSRRGKVTL